MAGATAGEGRGEGGDPGTPGPKCGRGLRALAARREREGRNDAVNLLGLDFGSTTSSAMVASARIGVSSATGRMEFGNPSVLYRSEPAFTPFDDEDLDIERLEGMIDGWLADSGLSENDVFAGGPSPPAWQHREATPQS
jgi:hypothetical protein